MSEDFGNTAPPTRSRIMFVDDDPFLLEGLRDALRPHRRRWQMTFAGSGEEALSVLEGEPQDVVVSDLRMPVMDGATLLGVISFFDVAKAVLEAQNFENQMLKAYIRDWPAEAEQ